MSRVRGSSVDHAAHVFGLEGRLVRLRLEEGPVHLTARIHEAEHARRCDYGIEALTDRGLVTALWEVPRDEVADPATIPSWAIQRLNKAGGSLVKEGPGGVRRQVGPPATVTGVLASGRVLSRLLVRVGQLSAIAPMAVILHGEVEPTDAALLDAALYGVGVITKVRGQREVLLFPEPVEEDDGPFPWWISELAYRELIRERDRSETTLSPVD